MTSWQFKKASPSADWAVQRLLLPAVGALELHEIQGVLKEGSQNDKIRSNDLSPHDFHWRDRSLFVFRVIAPHEEFWLVIVVYAQLSKGDFGV